MGRLGRARPALLQSWKVRVGEPLVTGLECADTQTIMSSFSSIAEARPACGKFEVRPRRRQNTPKGAAPRIGGSVKALVFDVLLGVESRLAVTLFKSATTPKGT